MTRTVVHDDPEMKQVHERTPVDGRRWFLDTERNGRYDPEIVELGLVETIDLRPTGVTHSWLIRPSRRMDPHTSRVHGILDEDVADRPTMDQLAAAISAVMGGLPVGGQSVHGDLDALARALPGWRPSSAIDTLPMARILLPGLRSYRIPDMTAQLGLRARIDDAAGGGAHTALNDAMACVVLIEEMRRRSTPDDFLAALSQAESLPYWDRLVERRDRRAEKATSDAEAERARLAAAREADMRERFAAALLKRSGKASGRP